jgi:hypothetical protein
MTETDVGRRTSEQAHSGYESPQPLGAVWYHTSHLLAGTMNIWTELTKKHEGAARFVVAGLGIAIVGAGFWLWSVLVSDDAPPSLAVSFVVVGLLVALGGAIIASRTAGNGNGA